jgi:hypothetical protein
MTDEQIRAALELLGWRVVADLDGEPVGYKGTRVAFYWSVNHRRWMWMPGFMNSSRSRYPDWDAPLPKASQLYGMVTAHEQMRVVYPSWIG